MTNNQKDALQSITVASDYPGDFSVSLLPTELSAGESATIDVSFLPTEVGTQTGKITVSTKGQYGPILLTLELSGTGVAS